MKSLRELLESMETLDSDDDYSTDPLYDSEVEEYLKDKGYDQPDRFQEPVSLSVASSLLSPNDFDPECTYQIITTADSTILIKIDDRVSDTDNPVSKLITEYDLNTDDEVQSYEEMRQSVVHGFHNWYDLLDSADATYNDDGSRVSSRTFVICCVVLIVLLVIGVNLIFFVLGQNV